LGTIITTITSSESAWGTTTITTIRCAFTAITIEKPRGALMGAPFQRTTEVLAHFLEMAQTWEWLGKQHESDNQLADTLALADAIANGREPIQKKAA
jgi:hypothetical protein